MKHSIGDKVWLCPYPKYIFAVLCTIREVDEKFKNYWVDEPIGHGVDDSEFLYSLDDALLELNWCLNDKNNKEVITLESFRKKQHDFIKGTWERGDIKHPGFEPLSDKKQGVEWLNVEDAKIDQLSIFSNDELEYELKRRSSCLMYENQPISDVDFMKKLEEIY